MVIAESLKLYKIFIMLGTELYRQIVGIPMRSN